MLAVLFVVTSLENHSFYGSVEFGPQILSTVGLLNKSLFRQR